MHSSAASHIHYVADKAQFGDATPTKADLSIAQLVASAMHNQSDKTLGQHLAGQAWVPDKIAAVIAAQAFMPTEGFIGYNPVTTPDKTAIARYYHMTRFVGGGDDDLPFRGLQATYTTREQKLTPIWEHRITKVLIEPDYRLRLDYLNATKQSRSFVKTPLTSAEKKMKEMIGAEEFVRYTKAFRDGRQLVGRNNIGEFWFGAPHDITGSYAVMYRIHFQSDGSNKQWQHHEIGLDLGPSYYPLVAYPT